MVGGTRPDTSVDGVQNTTSVGSTSVGDAHNLMEVHLAHIPVYRHSRCLGLKDQQMPLHMCQTNFRTQKRRWS